MHPVCLLSARSGLLRKTFFAAKDAKDAKSAKEIFIIILSEAEG